MRIRQELLLAVTGFLILQWLTSTTAIVLLQRTEPQVHTLIDSDDAFRDGVNRIAMGLAMSGAEGSAAVGTALAALRDADASPKESLLFDEISRLGPRACQGDIAARALVVDALSDLVALHDATTRDSQARIALTLSGGTWAAVALALASLGASVLLVKRTDAQLFGPVQDIADAVHAYHHGERHRRTRPALLPPPFGAIAQSFNELLDATTAQPQRETDCLAPGAVIALLERLPHPAAITRGDGRPDAASAAALELLHAGTPPTSVVQLHDDWSLQCWEPGAPMTSTETP